MLHALCAFVECLVLLWHLFFFHSFFRSVWFGLVSMLVKYGNVCALLSLERIFKEIEKHGRSLALYMYSVLCTLWYYTHIVTIMTDFRKMAGCNVLCAATKTTEEAFHLNALTFDKWHGFAFYSTKWQATQRGALCELPNDRVQRAKIIILAFSWLHVFGESASHPTFCAQAHTHDEIKQQHQDFCYECVHSR